MSSDVGTTPRKPLTPRQRLKLFEDHGGMCALCGTQIYAGEPWRDEHLRALGLGGSNDINNRAPVHERCAPAKDRDDMARINKSKAVKRQALGIKGPTAKIASRGFAPSQRSAERAQREPKTQLPRRTIFKDDWCGEFRAKGPSQ